MIYTLDFWVHLLCLNVYSILELINCTEHHCTLLLDSKSVSDVGCFENGFSGKIFFKKNEECVIKK